MKIIFTPSAVKDLRGLEVAIRKRIVAKLDFYININDPFVFAKRLRSQTFGEYRFRIGGYRVIFDVQGDNLIVLAIGDRKDIYR